MIHPYDFKIKIDFETVAKKSKSYLQATHLQGLREKHGKLKIMRVSCQSLLI